MHLSVLMLTAITATPVITPSSTMHHRNEPMAISFWNLQADDDHDFMLVAPNLKVLMMVKLPALQETSYVFTFH
jgi:hypothetical protein